MLLHGKLDPEAKDASDCIEDLRWIKSHQDASAAGLSEEDRGHIVGNDEADAQAKHAAQEARDLIPQDVFDDFAFARRVWRLMLAVLSKWPGHARNLERIKPAKRDNLPVPHNWKRRGRKGVCGCFAAVVKGKASFQQRKSEGCRRARAVMHL